MTVLTHRARVPLPDHVVLACGSDDDLSASEPYWTVAFAKTLFLSDMSFAKIWSAVDGHELACILSASSELSGA